MAHPNDALHRPVKPKDAGWLSYNNEGLTGFTIWFLGTFLTVMLRQSAERHPDEFRNGVAAAERAFNGQITEDLDQAIAGLDRTRRNEITEQMRQIWRDVTGSSTDSDMPICLREEHLFHSFAQLAGWMGLIEGVHEKLELIADTKGPVTLWKISLTGCGEYVAPSWPNDRIQALVSARNAGKRRGTHVDQALSTLSEELGNLQIDWTDGIKT